MSDLGTMKAEIASIIKRTGYETFIEEAVRHVIGDLQADLMFFAESHTLSFNTVAGQVYYDGDDDLDIPLINSFQAIHVRIANNDIPLRRIRTIDEFEGLNDAGVSNGQPIGFIYHALQIGLYPPPSDVFAITLMGGTDAAAPVDDDEENNVWMDPKYGYKVVMFAALEFLNRVRIRDYALATQMEAEKEKQKILIARRGARLKATNRIKPTSF